MSVGRSVCRSRLCVFGVFGTLRAVFSSLLLPNHMRLMPSCIRDPPLPLPSTLLLLPNTRDLCRFVYPALFSQILGIDSCKYAECIKLWPKKIQCVRTFKKMSQNDQKPQKMATNWHLLGGRPPQSHSNHLKCTACGKQQWAAQKNPHIAGQGPP